MVNKTLIAALALAFASSAAQAADAKNIIFFLGDGMGPATITAARIHKVKEEGLLHFEQFERTARIKTYSNDAQTTDSAPSMGAYMTGHKINNDVISSAATQFEPEKDANGNRSIARCDHTDKPYTTILELAKAAGKSVGSITTTELTHATPASTFSHVCHRDMAYQIAAAIAPGGAGYNNALGDGVDVLMGGGRNHFTPYDKAGNPKGRADGRDLLAEMAARGYVVATDRAQLMAARPGRKFIGIYSATSHLAYASERNAAQPTLAEMAVKSVEMLSQNPKGYFLMVEGGKIDHALHDSHARNAVLETAAFDDAIKAVLDKVRETDPKLEHTLLVVTADHDHTMTINGYPKRGNSILDIVRNFDDGQPARDADGKTFTTLVFGTGPNRPGQRSDVDGEVAQSHEYHQESGVRIRTETHGGGDVKLFATGAGSRAFKGTIENTKVFDLMKAAFGF
ncbi:MAG TPA: alkaline phosphatase [Telluria sp.]|nr:alkaline phosphatase [Telluria sp.]